MATVLLAIGDSALRSLTEAQLARAGHDTLVLNRPLQVLEVAAKSHLHVLLADDTALGREATLAAPFFVRHRLGLGFDAPGLEATLALPLEGTQLIEAVERLAPPQIAPDRLSLEPARRVARANGHEVALTRIEYQLLEAL
jgi:hypothetical protein